MRSMAKNYISFWASHSLLASLVWIPHHLQVLARFFSLRAPTRSHKYTCFTWSTDIYNNRIECSSGPYRIIVIVKENLL